MGERLRWLAQCLGFVFGLALGYAYRDEASTILFLIPVLICTIQLATGHAAGGGILGFWRANARLALALAVGFVAVGVAFLGLFIFSLAVESLLGLSIAKLALTLSAIGFAFVLPVFCLERARFDGAASGEAQENALLRILAALADLILIPLVVAFGLVIHIYAARIAYLGVMPKGEIGWIVSFYLICGYGLVVIVQGLETKLPRMRSLLHRLWFPSTAIPLVLLGLAIWMRIEAYGITEDRYALVLITVAGVLLAASALIRRPFDIRLVPLIVGALTLIAAIGPFSARNMTIRSQIERARTLLALVPPDGWTTPKDIWLDAEQEETLRSALSALRRRDAAESLLRSPAWPPQMNTTVDLENLLIARARVRDDVPETLFFHDQVIQVGLIMIFDVHRVTRTTNVKVIQGGITYESSMSGNVLEFTTEGKVTRFDLSPLLTLDNESRQMPILNSIEGRRGALAVQRFDRGRSEDKVISEISGKVVLY